MSTPVTVPADILRQVRRLELRTRRLVDSQFAGDYRSLFKGQGMEFSEVREYQPGDEVRTIDWNVSARMGRPFVKRYVEERELTVMLALDVSGSSRFGTTARFKDEIGVEVSALLALAAVRNNDRVGLLCFSDRVEHAVPPRKGRRHALRLLRDLLALQPVGSRTDFAFALERLARLLTHRSVVFVCSDFVGEHLESALMRLAQRHDVIALTVEDAAEQELPDIGIARLRDPETDEIVEVDTSDPAVREWFRNQVGAEVAAREKLFARLGIDEVVMRTDTGYVEPLLSFFRARARRAHGAVRTAARGAARGAVSAVATGLLACGVLSASVSHTLLAQPTPSLQSVRVGMETLSDTVTVGDPFTVRVRLLVPMKAEILWPALSDSAGVIALRAPLVRRAGPDNGNAREELADLDVAAWDTGAVVSDWPPIRVALGGDTLDVPFRDVAVYVRSVLPADTLAHIPRPAKAPFARVVSWWQRWWPALALVAGLLALWWWRRRRERRVAPAASTPVVLTAFERAMQAFDRLDRLAFVDAGEPGRATNLAMEVLRRYLSATIPETSRAQTSAELLAALGDDVRVPMRRLIALLVVTDTIKFARRELSDDEARMLTRETRDVVAAIDMAMQPLEESEPSDIGGSTAMSSESSAQLVAR